MEVIDQTIGVHYYLVFILLALICINLYFIYTTKAFVVLGRYLKSVTPLFHTINGALAYTGVVAMAFNHDLRWQVVVMIPVSIIIMMLEIIRRKKMKIIKSDEYEKQKAFLEFAKKVYIIDISLLVFTFALVKIFHS